MRLPYDCAAMTGDNTMAHQTAWIVQKMRFLKNGGLAPVLPLNHVSPLSVIGKNFFKRLSSVV